MKTFGYLIGAGASKQALPVVQDMGKRMMSMYKQVDRGEGAKRKEWQTFSKHLNWLIVKSSRHASVDTFAKKLFLAGLEDDLVKLKALLSAYFVFEEGMNLVDSRYDSFFASLLAKGKFRPVLPNNIKIVSWNYDTQPETSISEFIQEEDVNEISKYLGIWPKRPDELVPDENKGFSIYKLNGIARVGYQDKELHYLEDQLGFNGKLDSAGSPKPNTRKNIVKAISVFEQIMSRKMTSSLTFAWEKNGAKIMKAIQEGISDVEILVIVGYSFPNFNRPIDSEILSYMPLLQKIYVQDPNPGPVEQRLKATLGESKVNALEGSIISIIQVDEFFIPFEYELPI